MKPGEPPCQSTAIRAISVAARRWGYASKGVARGGEDFRKVLEGCVFGGTGEGKCGMCRKAQDRRNIG